jgi:putative colanic acid biosynthesis UDP-glucose lipid carrier transferase
LRQWGNGWAVWVINTDIDCLKMAQNSTQIFFRSDPNAKELVQWLVEPLSAICMWLLAANFTGSRLGAEDFVVCLMLFLLMFPGKWAERLGVGAAIDVVINWLFVAAILGLLAYATGFYRDFDQQMIIYWVAGTPLLQLLAYALVGWQLRRLFSSEQHIERVMVVGLNDTGRRLAKEVNSRRQYGMQLVCFADDRSGERLGNNAPAPVMGGLEDVADLVRQNDISRIYVALPMASQPRILKLLDDLRDTTASIYFVPDLFIFDLIQARVDRVADIPVVAVCETPFYGINLLLKRLSDIVLSSLILLMIAPIMLAVAIAVKMSSPGPMLFKQRRYGLDGKEILVYKFRSMTVTEDGAKVVQATKNDQRITRVGAFIRKTSLDELPQFINVLEGKMSIVGPRPHAVAHNEQYRKLIKGYMVRHKVKPGITGWAQVNGYRGETETLDKMEKRIEYDLDYLRNWSLRLDLSIIIRTALLVVKDSNAY